MAQALLPALVIFDCDGVLVDSEPIVNRVFVEMWAEIGFELDYERSLREFSGGSMSIRLEKTQSRLRWSAPPDFVGTFDRRLREVMRRELRPVPGVMEALAALRIPWCVASNGSHEDMQTRLGLAGLRPRFEPRLFSASEVGRGKPHPDVYLHAAHCMAVEPSRCAVVEDSVAGVQAGVQAGMAVYGYAPLTPSDALRRAGARVFTDMQELPSLLQGGSYGA
jgi:HAD superfamily hydrolase (TIGR01509 family)